MANGKQVRMGSLQCQLFSTMITYFSDVQCLYYEGALGRRSNMTWDLGCAR